MWRGRARERSLRPAIPSTGPRLPLGLQSKTWPRPQGAQPGWGAEVQEGAWQKHTKTRGPEEAGRVGAAGKAVRGDGTWLPSETPGPWGQGRPHSNTWRPLGPNGGAEAGGSCRGRPGGGRGAAHGACAGRSQSVCRLGPLTFEHLALVPEQRLQAAALPPQAPQRLAAQLARHFCQGEALCWSGVPKQQNACYKPVQQAQRAFRF